MVIREIRVKNASIFFETVKGVKFNIEVRRNSGISVFQNGKRVFNRQRRKS